MASRHQLHDELEEVLGSKNVYYQPPASFKMSYPAIRYALNRIDAKRADNSIYTAMNSYTITIIDSNPDSDIALRILKRFPTSRFDGKRYVSDNLYHDTVTIKY